jgi:hypothetical protein
MSQQRELSIELPEVVVEDERSRDRNEASPPRHRLAPRPRRLRPRTRAAWVFLGYLIVSILFFGIPVLAHMTTRYIGLANGRLGPGVADPSFYMWSFVWWPHALTHGLNPFFSHAVWAPIGFNIAWTTSVPGAALLAWPITALFGPIASYNAWMLMAPALAAWGAFLLCRHVSKAFWPSVAGGFLFGFSSYELAQMTTHLDLSLIFVIPLAVYLVLRRLDGEITVRRFVVLLTVALVAQFSFFLETFFSMTLFGGIVLLTALALSPPEVRARLRRTAKWIGLAYLATTVIVSPYLYYALAHGLPPSFAAWPARYSSDLMNFVWPTRIAAINGGAGYQAVVHHFRAGLGEEGAYFGPLLIVVGVFAATRWRTLSGKLLTITFLVVSIFSLGPRLHLDGTSTVPLPWGAVSRLPLLDNALPARFIVYAWLAVALMVATWLGTASTGRRAGARWAVVGLSAALLFPNLAVPLWRSGDHVPPFIADGIYRSYIVPGQNVLVIPAGSRGFSMLWQAETNFAFSMSGGYLSCAYPPEFQRWPIMYTFLSGRLIPDYRRQLREFLAANDIGTVLLVDGATGPWTALFGTLQTSPVDVGGVTVYRPSPESLAPYRDAVPDGSQLAAISDKCS